MKIDLIYHREPVTIPSSVSVRETLEVMLKHKVNSLVVVDNHTVSGVVTTEDIARAVVPDEFETNTGMADAMYKPHFFEELCAQLGERPISTIVRTDYLSVSPSSAVMTVAADFLKNNLYVVPVIESGKLVGIVTRTQILNAITQALHLPVSTKS